MTEPERRPVGIRASSWGWRHGGRAAWAVSDLDLRIEPGERVLLLGASGSGKSTLLAALAGVLGGDDDGEQRGTLTVDGDAPRRARGRAGLVLQDPQTQVVLPRVGDEVAFGCENRGVPREQIWPRVRDALRVVGLDVPLDAATSALSGGQQQRLALATALAMRPGLLLLDEPTANLDPDGAAAVRTAVDDAVAATGATLVVVEHRVGPWLPLVDRIVVLGGGGLLADGPAATVLARHGAALAERGIWVPGREPIAPRPSCPPGSELLRTDGLTVGRRGGFARPVQDFGVRAGALLALTGPNGVGKSTLALTLGGLLPPVAGLVRASEPLAGGAGPEPIHWRSKQLLTRIGSVFQSPQHQFLRPTVQQELAVGLRAIGAPDRSRRARVDELLARLDLTALAEANPFTLSGGQQRRLSVGGVLAAAPQVVVLDEPTFGQDSATWLALVALLAEVAQAGTAVVAATHDEALVAAAVDRVQLGRMAVAA